MFEVKTGVFTGSGIRVVFLRHKVFVECINEKGQGKLCFFYLANVQSWWLHRWFLE